MQFLGPKSRFSPSKSQNSSTLIYISYLGKEAFGSVSGEQKQLSDGPGKGILNQIPRVANSYQYFPADLAENLGMKISPFDKHTSSDDTYF